MAIASADIDIRCCSSAAATTDCTQGWTLASGSGLLWMVLSPSDYNDYSENSHINWAFAAGCKDRDDYLHLIQKERLADYRRDLRSTKHVSNPAPSMFNRVVAQPFKPMRRDWRGKSVR